jgi:hypothetical protein
MISLSALAAPAVPFAFDRAHTPGTGVALDITKMSPAHTSISLRSPAVVTENQVVGYENFQAFSLQGEPFIPAEGHPTVPQVSRFYQIPNTGGVDLVISDAEYDVVDNINSLPYQGVEGDVSRLVRDPDIYTKDGWYPANVAIMTDPMIMRDFRVVQVTLHPVQVNPVTHQARIYRNISVDVVANNQPGIRELTHPHRISGSWVPIYRNAISNLDDSALDDATTTPGRYLIVTSTSSQIRNFADSLAEWKTRKGFKVQIAALSDVSSPQTVKNAILAAYNDNTAGPLEYVALMGDPDWSGVGIPGDFSNFDHFYADLTGDDLEEVAVGRLSGGSTSAMATIHAKILGYERNPHMESSPGVADTMWFHKAYFQASTAFQCASNYTLMQWAAGQFRLYTGVDSSVVQQVSGFDRSAAVTRFNQGISFFFWRGSMQEVDPGLGEATQSGWRLPITMTVTCSAGNYQGSNGMAEALLTAGTTSNPKGGICGIGPSTGGTHHPENVTMSGGFMYGAVNAGMEHLGDAYVGAKTWLALTFGDFQSEWYLFTRYNNLFGDPGLSMWTDVPKILNVTHPTSLNVGARRVEITVQRQGDDQPVQNALVCLWKRGSDSTWVVGNTDAAGHIVLPVSVNASGSMYLTVTKQNHKPYLFTIPCNNVDCMPMLSHYTVDDDNTGGTQGNNDGVVNAGETIDLPIHIRNFGTTATATGISATMTSTNPHVTVVNGTTTYADIAPGDSVVGAQPFRIHMAPTTPNHDVVQLTLTITSNAAQSSGVLELSCVAGDLEFQRSQFVDGAFGPGATRNLSITVKNNSLVPLTGVTGHLQSFSPFVTLNTVDAAYGAIGAGARDSNLTSPFVVSANPMAFRGHQAPMLLVLTGDNGFVDSTQFVISVGTATTTDPSGPDAGGYFAYDNTDVSYELHPTFSYVDLASHQGINLNIDDSGEKTSTSQVWSTYRLLPFPVKFYGRTYDTLTICSNGWCAFGNQAWYDIARNYPIPAMQAPEAMIAPYWDDLVTSGSSLGVWVRHDPDSGRYVIQWKATNAGSPAVGLDFEVVLYDSVARPTMDGNNHILVQYNHAAMSLNITQDNERPGCTIGIQAPRGMVGLPIAYCDWTNPSMATIQDGRAILFTTDARVLFGQVDGHVLDAATNQPLAGVHVATDRYGFQGVTDATGHYHLTNVMIGNYRLIASKYRFNTDTVANVLVSLDSTTVVDYSLHHPEITLSTEAVVDTAVDDAIQATFNIVNNGNGLLDYTTRLFYAGDENTTPWDSVGSVDVTTGTNDHLLWGCEFWRDQWWASGAAAMDGHGMLYRFNRDGSPAGSIPQPSTTPLGWFDMATDGNLLYGSDSRAIYGINAQGEVMDTIPSPLNPSRAIAYDPRLDLFWVADYSSDIYAIDRSGTQIARVPNNGASALSITGLAWNADDPNGYKLYIFSRDPNQAPTRIRVTRMLPVQPFTRETATDLAGLPGDQAGGCTVTSNWNNSLVVFGALLHNGSAGDRIGIYETAFNSSWISLSPATGTVGGGQSQQMTVNLNPTILRTANYTVMAHISSTVCDTLMRLPITFVVRHTPTDVKPQPPQSIPTQFALQQNYPNPFNPTTQIRFDLPQAQHVRLRIFNALGQLVATLVDETRDAGSYTITWDARNVSTGLYLYQIKAGNFVETRKMLLMK